MKNNKTLLELKDDINNKLQDLEKFVLTDDFIKQAKKCELWGGADVIIEFPKPNKTYKFEDFRRVGSTGFYGYDDLVVITKYAKELSKLFFMLKETFKDRLDYANKYYFYTELAKAGIKYIWENMEVENKIDLLSAVIKRAYEINRETF